MKRLSVLIILLSTCLLTFSQFEYYKPDTARSHSRKGGLIVSLAPNVLFNTPNGTQIAGGIKVQFFLGKRFSLDADMVFSWDYLHLSPGLIGVPLGLLGVTLDDEEGTFGSFLFTLAALALSFEHISYHLPVYGNLDISPYVSLLRYKYAYEYGNYSNPDFAGEQLCFASGVQINKYFGRFVFSPYTEYNIGYKDHISGLNVGIYCGIYFQTKL